MRRRLTLSLVMLLGLSPGLAARDLPNNPRELLELAQQKAGSAEWADALPLWKKLVQNNPVRGDYWRRLAEVQYRLKDYSAAVEGYQKAMDLGASFRWSLAYNIACCHALQGDKQKAIDWLEKAFLLGYRNLRTPLSDSDLKSLRQEPRFQALMGTLPKESPERTQGWQHDLQLLHREILRKHPNPYRVHSKAEMEAYVKRLHDAVPGLSDAQMEVGLMKLARMVGDGHTFLRPPLPLRAVPIQFAYFEDGMFITAAAPKHADLVGARLMKIGDHATDSVLATLDAVVSQDNSMGLKSLGPFLLSTPRVLHGLGLIPSAEELPLTLRDAQGKERQLKLAADHEVASGRGLAEESWVMARKDAVQPDPLYLKNRNQAYWFEYLPESKLVFCQYNSVRNQGKETLAAFCDRMFQFIKDHDVEALILDMRWNGGGNSFLNRSLVHGLIRCEKLQEQGKLFVIIGRQTFSAAQNCTTDIEMHTNALFVGEPTGSCPNFIGETVPISLPFSKMSGSISDLNWVRGWPMDQRCWIAPHLYAPPVFSLYKDNRDPALEAILAYRQAAETKTAAQKPTATKEDLKAQVKQWNEAMEAAMRKGDLQGVANFYADDGVLVGPQGFRVAGREAIDTYWKRMQSPKDWQLDVLSVEGGKGVIVQRGRSRLTTMRDGKERVSQVEFVLIWQQQKDGAYKIAMDAYW